jgi:multiple sugar transport system permease protein
VIDTRVSRRLRLIVIYVLAALLLFWTLFPIYWLIVSSFKPTREIIGRIPTFWPARFVLDHYRGILTSRTFLMSLWNSIYISGGSTAVTIFLSLLAGYAIARQKMKGKQIMSQFVLFTYLIPLFMLFIPFYIMLSKIGLTNKTGALFLVYPVLCIPYATWIFIAYLKSIPRELEEAALLDGYARFAIIMRIIVPIAMPGVMATAIYTFTRIWNDYLMAFILINSPKHFTVMLAIADLIIGDQVAWGRLFAASVISSIPVTVIYFLAAKEITAGLTAGAVKQ